MKNVLIPLAEGFEEIEAITVIDILRRANVNVTTASLDKGEQVNPVKASRNSLVLADTTLEQAMQQNYDMIILPGGLPGADNLDKDPRIHQLLKQMDEQEKMIAAICAAPKVLANAGLLKDKTYTCYPGSINADDYGNKMTGSLRLEKNVVECYHIITAKGPAVAIEFALTLVQKLANQELSRQIGEDLLFYA